MSIRSCFTWILLICISLLLYACNGHHERSLLYELGKLSNSIKMAKGFRMANLDDMKVLEVIKPWQGADEVQFRYILVKEMPPVDDTLHNYGTVIKVPIERIVCTSTTHIAFLELLGKLEPVVGISGADLISNDYIKQNLLEGTIADIGYDRELNFEELISTRPELVVTYGIENEITGFVTRLIDLDIPVVLNGEYLEEHPLGKLEWIKFMAAFFDVDSLANHLYDSIAKSYLNLKSLVKEQSERPVVMTGLPWKDVWYVSGSNSTLANFISDAGAVYLWNELHTDKAVPMDVESIFEKGTFADYWINSGTANSLDDLSNMDQRFNHFSSVIQKKVYNNNLRLNETGGNDYWESGITSPDIILQDLIHIFHPELLNSHDLRYYKKLK